MALFPLCIICIFLQSTSVLRVLYGEKNPIEFGLGFLLVIQINHQNIIFVVYFITLFIVTLCTNITFIMIGLGVA